MTTTQEISILNRALKKLEDCINDLRKAGIDDVAEELAIKYDVVNFDLCDLIDEREKNEK